MYNQICKLHTKMSEYVNQVPVIGFRSSKYDLLVVRSKLFPKLGLHIRDKKTNRYTSRKYVITRGVSQQKNINS